MSQDTMKKNAAVKAMEWIKDDMIVGVGTGSTVNFFIEALAEKKQTIEAAVSSSKASEDLLRANGIPVIDMNSVSSIDVYVDGADEATEHKHLIKGGGGALTGEKIVLSISKQFVCIIDEHKLVGVLGEFPLPIEVIPMARSAVARQMVLLGGDPELRDDFKTDHGNIILDIYNLKIIDPIELEKTINQIPGVVTNGLFAQRGADVLVVGHEQTVTVI